MAILELLLLITGTVSVTVVGLALIRPFVKRNFERGHNEMAGAIFVVGGTIYAVLLAFIVIAAWETHDHAEAVVEDEASLLATLYRASAAMERQSGDRLRSLVRQYTEAVITDEWKLQERGGVSERARMPLLEMYRLFGSLSLGVRRDNAAIDQAQLAILAQIQADRTKRALLSRRPSRP